MAKKPANHQKDWSKQEVKRLDNLAEHNTPTGVIGIKLRRSEGSVRSKAQQEGISLKPTNQSPYNRRKR